MAVLAVAMRRDFPQFYKYFSTQSFNWKGRKYGNHNKLLAKYSGTDGSRQAILMHRDSILLPRLNAMVFG
jgi:D-alanyl-D-alanine carboxypeptidase